MKRFTERLILHLEKQGYRGCVVSTEHLCDLEEAIEGRHERRLLDEEFYQERLTQFKFHPPDSLPEAESMIVVAVPRPQSKAVFEWDGKSHSFVLPPTYVAYDDTKNRIENLVGGILKSEGFRLASARLPLKTLAVQSGLGRYGRNNICYVAGMGSFLQLVAVYSDLPCQEDNWQKAQMMGSCQHCQACLQNCPTGAIRFDRFLLSTEKCIVFHNEKPGDIPFPLWLDSSWHNCLVGCLHCQRVCPKNKHLLEWFEGKEEFSEEETNLLLEGATVNQLPSATEKKLRRLDWIEDVSTLPRNLGVLLKTRSH